jgi:hypothetical protein
MCTRPHRVSPRRGANRVASRTLYRGATYPASGTGDCFGATVTVAVSNFAPPRPPRLLGFSTIVNIASITVRFRSMLNPAHRCAAST